jgi:hypothetical protein
MQAASDEEIFDHAAQDDRVIVSADTDFGTLLAIRKQPAPSVILFRHGSQHRPAGGWRLYGPNRQPDRYARRTGSVAAELRTTGSHPSMRPVTSTVTR